MLWEASSPASRRPAPPRNDGDSFGNDDDDSSSNTSSAAGTGGSTSSTGEGGGFDPTTVKRGNGLDHSGRRMKEIGGTCVVESKSGAGTYVYGANATITWTYAPGYEVTSVTDNGTTLPSAAYAGNSYTLSGIAADHAIVINTRMTLFSLTYNGNGGTVGGNASYSATKTMGTSFAVDANTFTRAGYYYLGRSTSSTASVADPAYAPGTSVTMPSNDLTAGLSPQTQPIPTTPLTLHGSQKATPHCLLMLQTPSKSSKPRNKPCAHCVSRCWTV